MAAALSRLSSLTNKTSLQNLIHRHLLRPGTAAAAAAVHFDLENPKSCSAVHFTGNNKLSFSNSNEFILNRNLPTGGVSALRTFDLSIMEVRDSRSTSSKKYSPDLEDDVKDDDDEDSEFEDYDDDDDDGSCNDSDDDDDDYGRRGGGAAYRV